MNDRVDILMGTYNGERFLEGQIKSILSQTHASLHLFIRDDQSTDRTPEMLEEWEKKYPSQITLIRDTKRLGVRGNFSALMSHAKAPYVMFCDQDDVWDADKVSKTLACMKRIENQKGLKTPLLVHTDLRVVNQSLQPIHPSFWSYSHLDPYSNRALNRALVENTVTGCATMINRPLLELAWPIPPECMMHDWWLALTAAAFGSIGLINEPTLSYRQHGNNAVGAKQYTIISYLKNGLKKWSDPEPRRQFYKQNFHQARLFLDRFKERLPKEEREQIQAYIDLPSCSFLRSRYQMLKHGFLKKGWMRNLVYFALRFPKEEKKKIEQ